MKVLFVFGTRPEAIKLAPVIRCLREDSRFETRIAVTAQHRAMLDQVLAAFAIQPDHDLNVMQAGQTLSQSASRMIAALEPVLEQEQPDCVVVQGDTTTTFCGALAAFYQSIPVAHIEAGMRTGDLRQPFPEEMNRVLTSRLASLHFAATEWGGGESSSRRHLQSFNIFVTGNTGIDAVMSIRDRVVAFDPSFVSKTHFGHGVSTKASEMGSNGFARCLEGYLESGGRRDYFSCPSQSERAGRRERVSAQRPQYPAY